VTEKPLTGKVALVAGATRAAGRGIAVELGAAGATVYCAGRTTRTTRSEYDRAETIEETAELVDDAGGEGIAVAVDLLDPRQVDDLVRRIDDERGALDVLVNDAGAAHLVQFETPFWEYDLDDGLRMLRLGVETHLVTARAALPLLIRKPGGLVVEMGDGTTGYNATRYRVSVFYDLTKSAVNRLAFALGEELEPHGATAVAITPGWLRSEAMLDAFQVTEENWRDATVPGFGVSETPRYVGRAVAAVAADPDRARWNQRSLTVGELANEYGFTDVDGSQPDAWAFMLAQEADPNARIDDYR